MRQKILLLIILIGNLDCFAQDLPRYGELLCDKMYWGYWSKFTAEWYQIDGFRTINEKTYGQLQIQRQHFDGARAADGSTDYYKWLSATIGIRDEGGRVYVNKEEYLGLMTEEYYWIYVGRSDSLPYETTPDGELVLYDFNKNAGDIYCKMPDGSELTVITVDTLKTEDGVPRRRLTLSNGFDLIEGVGCTNSTGFLLFWLNTKDNHSKSEAPGFLTSFGFEESNGQNKRILARDYTATINEMNGNRHKIMRQGRRWVYDYDNGETKGNLIYSIEGDTLLHAYKRAKLKMTLIETQTQKVIRSGYIGFFSRREQLT